MRTFTAIVFTATLLSGCGEQTTVPNRDADINALTHAKVETWRGLYRSNDAEGLSAFLHDDFTFIPGGGDILTKKDEVDYVAKNPSNMPDDFLFTVEDIIFTSPDTAIVYGQGNSTRTNEDGQPCRHSYRSSNTFRRIGKDWNPVFSHVSGAKCEVGTF